MVTSLIISQLFCEQYFHKHGCADLFISSKYKPSGVNTGLYSCSVFWFFCCFALFLRSHCSISHSRCTNHPAHSMSVLSFLYICQCGLSFAFVITANTRGMRSTSLGLHFTFLISDICARVCVYTCWPSAFRKYFQFYCQQLNGITYVVASELSSQQILDF